MIAVQSSNLVAVDYDGSGTLTILFHNGGLYRYAGVPYAVYSGLMEARSHGQFFHVRIKNRYPSRRIK